MDALLLTWSPALSVGAGFIAGNLLGRRLISPAYVLLGSAALVVAGMLLAFSLPGFGLILAGLTLFGVAAGIAIRRRVARLR